MANIKSQIKRNRQNEKRRLRNRNFRGAARTAIKDAHTALGTGEETQASVAAAISALDKAAQKGSIHPRNAARRKSRLMKMLGKSASKTQPKAEKKTAPKKSASKKTGAAASKKSAAGK